MKKVVFAFILGLITAGSIAGVVAFNYDAKDISYTPKDSNWNVKTVEEALKDLKTNPSNINISEDLTINTSEVTTVSMKITVNQSFNNALYIYSVNNTVVKTGNSNSVTVGDLDPDTSYNIQVIVRDSEGNTHIGTKTKSTASAVWLYKDGTEYDLSGGFSIQGYVGGDNYTLTKEDNYMRLNVPSNKRATFMRENNLIDFSQYKKAYVKIYNSNGNPAAVFISTRTNYNGADINSGDLGLDYYKESTGEDIASFDTSSITNNAYIYVRKTHAGYIDIKRIWLEK